MMEKSTNILFGATDKAIKCVVWDLDNTLWDGILLEDNDVHIRKDMVDVIKELDKRGILNSIASKNDYDLAAEVLRKNNIFEYFLYPMIGWDNKSESISRIADKLNLNLSEFAFIDDQLFELAEVHYHHAEVLCMDSGAGILELPAFQQKFISEEAGSRRQNYIAEINRKQIEAASDNHIMFLKSLEMVLTIKKATSEHLLRAGELTNRTHQMNTTGLTYSLDQLRELSVSPDYILLIAGLEDKFGSYGKIGLAIIHCQPEAWCIKLFLLSCRVMNRGIAVVFLNHIVKLARKREVRLFAEFKPNDRNRIMLVTYKFNGFQETGKTTESDNLLLEYNFTRADLQADYLETIVSD